MTHLGSAKDLGKKEALKKVVAGIKEILKGYGGSTQFLMEISAGAGEIMGDNLDEIAWIIKTVETFRSSEKNRRPVRRSVKGLLGSAGGWPTIGVCVDTAHAFASGYDLRDKKAVKKFLDEFDEKIELKKLKIIHINDSVYDLGSRKDRHAHLGEGKIGLVGFEALVKEPRLKKVNFILETPTEEGALRDIRLLKKWREEK
jgi:deoxyribonuclease-4